MAELQAIMPQRRNSLPKQGLQTHAIRFHYSLADTPETAKEGTNILVGYQGELRHGIEIYSESPLINCGLVTGVISRRCADSSCFRNSGTCGQRLIQAAMVGATQNSSRRQTSRSLQPNTV